MILSVCANPSVDSLWSVKTLEKGHINRSKAETFYPGGKGIHTAFALRELGQNVTALGVWGGQTGEWLQQQCRKRNIATVGPSVKGWNRLCITVKSDSPWNETELLGSGPKVDNKAKKDVRSVYKQCIVEENIEAIIISGSVPRGFKDDFYSWLVDEAQNQDIPVFIDAAGPLLKRTLTSCPFGIHVNREEGQQLCGKKDPTDIAKWLGRYCELAAVTAGADGLYLSYKNELLHASHQIDNTAIFSTIGSGDCLLAGLCLAYLRKNDLEYWTRFAVACGSANCIHPKLGMLKRDDVNAILPNVAVTKIDPEGFVKPSGSGLNYNQSQM